MRLDALPDVAELFRLTRDEARAVLADVSDATTGWRAAAQVHGTDRAAVEQMDHAFEHEQADVAREIAGSVGQRGRGIN